MYYSSAFPISWMSELSDDIYLFMRKVENKLKFANKSIIHCGDYSFLLETKPVFSCESTNTHIWLKYSIETTIYSHELGFFHIIMNHSNDYDAKMHHDRWLINILKMNKDDLFKLIRHLKLKILDEKRNNFKSMYSFDSSYVFDVIMALHHNLSNNTIDYHNYIDRHLSLSDNYRIMNNEILLKYHFDKSDIHKSEISLETEIYKRYDIFIITDDESDIFNEIKIIPPCIMKESSLYIKKYFDLNMDENSILLKDPKILYTAEYVNLMRNIIRLNMTFMIYDSHVYDILIKSSNQYIRRMKIQIDFSVKKNESQRISNYILKINPFENITVKIDKKHITVPLHVIHYGPMISDLWYDRYMYFWANHNIEHPFLTLKNNYMKNNISIEDTTKNKNNVSTMTYYTKKYHAIHITINKHTL